MLKHLWYPALLLLCAADAYPADTSPWRATAQLPPPNAAELQRIAQLVCGELGYKIDAAEIQCNGCPAFTGDAASEDGLEIVAYNRGHFTGDGAGEQWLLDTQGCEAHYESFGGALLLARPKPNTRPAAKAKDSGPAAQALQLLHYRPGYRLNDCLPFETPGPRTLLVCNEFDITQGEVIGHVSTMEVSQRGITRWRLLRWYDNTGSDQADVVSVSPTDMRRVTLEDGRPGLSIRLAILQTTRTAYEQSPDTVGKPQELLFLLEGARFFATPKTQVQLSRIGALTRRMAD